MINPKQAILIDASVYIFRGYYSVPSDFVDINGNPANAIHGFANFLCNLLEQSKPEQIACAFDISLTTSFRNEIYPAYKANRESPPVELKQQFSLCFELADCLGINCLKDEHYEADDIIGTLATNIANQGGNSTIVSTDKDLAQLLKPGDILWDFANKKRYDHVNIVEKHGVKSEQIVDYLALAGDSVDNIPGIPGIGNKTAAVLLNHYQTLDNLIEKATEVQYLSIRGAKRISKLLTEHKDLALLSKKLTQIHCEVPNVKNLYDLNRKQTNKDKLQQLFEQFKFGPLLRRRCLSV